MPDVVQPCVLSIGGGGMSCPTLFDRLCIPNAVIACHARRRSTVCATQRRLWHAMPDVVRPCVLPKDDDGMQRPTLFYHVRYPKAVMRCDAIRRSTACVAKGDDGMPRPTSFNRIFR